MKKTSNKTKNQPKAKLIGVVQAGFPIHSDGFEGENLNMSLDELIVRNPVSTFFMRVSGLSMKNIGIFEGDLVVVDRSRGAKNGDVVVCYLDQGFTLKRLQTNGKEARLIAEDGLMPELKLGADDDTVWGVVTAVVRQLH